MKTKFFLTILIACTITAAATFVFARHHFHQPDGQSSFIADSIESRTLNEERGLIVHLPESYGRSSARYPVLYVLDGSSHASHTAESLRLMARIGAIPEMIIVGVPSSGENRQRDYTPHYLGLDDDDPKAGQADRFLQFMERELIPHIDRRYRTTPTRMLAGNSRGGLFVIYSLLERPNLFSARFAFSPALWRENDRIVGKLDRFVRGPSHSPTFLYLSLGDGENEKMTRGFRKASTVLESAPSHALRWKAQLTRGADHQTNALLSTPVGVHEYWKTSR